jgi:hypothetical protein
VQTIAGEAIFATGWEDWDDMPEVVALRKVIEAGRSLSLCFERRSARFVA